MANFKRNKKRPNLNGLFFHNPTNFKIYFIMNEFQINHEKIENYIKRLIYNNEVFDENCIYDLTIDYCKYSQINISEQNIKEIIRNVLNFYQSQDIITPLENEIYTFKNNDCFFNPMEKAISCTEYSTFEFSIDGF